MFTFSTYIGAAVQMLHLHNLSLGPTLFFHTRINFLNIALILEEYFSVILHCSVVRII